MIFKNYRELINYVLSHFPYEKIITYCRDMNYKWLYPSPKNCNYLNRAVLPTTLDIKKSLVCSLSLFCYNYTNRNKLEISLDDSNICNICRQYSGVPYNFNIHFTESKKKS